MAQPGPSVDPLFLSFQLALAGRYSIDRELGRGEAKEELAAVEKELKGTGAAKP